MNYFIEGIQGAGKSTLVGKISERLPDFHVFREGDYNPVELAWCAYLTKEQYEMILEKYAGIADEIKAHTKPEKNTEERYIVSYTQILTDIPGFHKDLEQYEIYNGRVDRKTFEEIILSRYSAWTGENEIFECSIFQNIIENQILFFEMSDDEIIDFYKRLKSVIKTNEFKILYLESDDIAGNIDKIRKERVDEHGNEIWFKLMMGFLEECPYGLSHGLKDFDGLIKHFEHRMSLELRILKEIFPKNSTVLRSKNYDIHYLDDFFPEKIKEMLDGKEYMADEIGKSQSLVRIYDDSVLKVEKEREKLPKMIEVMQWLDGKLPVPKVIYTEVYDGYRYLVMSRVTGRIACDPYYMEKPEELLTLLAESLKMLWSIDISDCPRVCDIEDDLEEAKYRVEHNLVDLDDVEPETFGEGGFKDPEELLKWLCDNKPETEPVFSHGDFCLPNVLFENGKVSGLIDLVEAGISDKWRDIALCYRSLRWNAEGDFGKVYKDVNKDDLFKKLGIEPDWKKIRYHILLDELF